MKWDIYDYASGCIVATIEARTAREALLKYLMEHEELNDMMIWKSTIGKTGGILLRMIMKRNFCTLRQIGKQQTCGTSFSNCPKPQT